MVLVAQRSVERVEIERRWQLPWVAVVVAGQLDCGWAAHLRLDGIFRLEDAVDPSLDPFRLCRAPGLLVWRSYCCVGLD